MFFISSAPLTQAFKYSVCHKKVPNRILYFIFGDKILGQSGPKRPKKAQTVQENQGGQKWSKTIVSQHRPQNSVSNCFRDTNIYLIMYYNKYISPPILGFKWDWSEAKCTEHYVASCTSFSFEQELHYSAQWSRCQLKVA